MIDATDPNALQRVAANPFESAWVAASAGSGKTKVLSDRVLNLLLTGTPPEKILCLTFTRTAAAQMANKISERLGKWAAEDESDLIKDLTDLRNAPPDAPLIARARRLFARLLDTAGGLKITTLHGFCQSLLKRFPLEAGVSPHFDVTDESGAKDLIARAQTDVLRDSAYADCLKTITLMTDEDGFLKLLAEMTFHMSKLRRINERFKTPEALKAAYESALSLPSNATKESLTRDFCRLSEERKAALKTAVAILSESTKSTDTKNGAVIADFLTADETDRLERLDKYIDAFVTQSDTIRSRLVCKESAGGGIEDHDPARLLPIPVETFSAGGGRFPAFRRDGRIRRERLDRPRADRCFAGFRLCRLSENNHADDGRRRLFKAFGGNDVSHVETAPDQRTF